MPGSRERKRDGDSVLGSLFAAAVAAVIVGLALVDYAWGHDIWGDLAPAWPGGGYAFALTVGFLLPYVAATAIAPLARMNWKRSKARSLAWAAAALPGAVASALLVVVVFAAFRPRRRRNWDSDCYAEGGPCWVHEQYPYVWAVGLAATLAGAALLFTVLVKYVGSRDAEKGDPEKDGPRAPESPAEPAT